MNSIASILQKLPQNERATESRTGRPEQTLTVVVIAKGDAPADEVSAHIVCIGMKTAGVIITPLHWRMPNAQGSKLWAPPDRTGWQIMDVMTEAGVGNVEFWNVAQSG